MITNCNFYIHHSIYLPVEPKPLKPLSVSGNSSYSEHSDNFTVSQFSKAI